MCVKGEKVEVFAKEKKEEVELSLRFTKARRSLDEVGANSTLFLNLRGFG